MRFEVPTLRELPPVTRWLLALSFAGWIAELVSGSRINVSLGLVPYLFTREYWLWQGFTYIFIHAGFWHFLFNAFMLWMLGRMLEPLMGPRKFLLYFLGCGFAAALVTAAWSPDSLRPVIGASGAVFGLLGAFAFLFPDTTVYFYFLFPMSARMMTALLCVVELAMTLSAPSSGISNITHIGGMAAGLGWLWTERRLRERAERPAPAAPPAPDPALLEQEEIDRLLEKISRKGRSSLNASELARLDNYSRRGGRA